ncbi:MAG: hypothetical protein AB7U73_19005, partial [Pirellulales bacterium]
KPARRKPLRLIRSQSPNQPVPTTTFDAPGLPETTPFVPLEPATLGPVAARRLELRDLSPSR